MAITQAVCNSFKEELMEGIHDLDSDTLKIALFTSSATLGASTTAYTTSNEVSGTGYTAGGNTLTVAGGTPSLDGSTAILDFDDTQWTSATFTARGALVYNSSKANRALFVLDFSGDFSVSSGTFRIEFPTADASNAILRLA